MTVVDEAMGWLTGTFHRSGTGDVVYTAEGGATVLPGGGRVTHEVGALLDGLRDGAQFPQPWWWEMALESAAVFRSLERCRSALAESERRRAVGEVAFRDYKRNLRDDLATVQTEHSDHISREQLNDFLLNHGMEAFPRVFSATVTLHYKVTVEVEDVEVEYDSDVDEALASAARDQVHSHMYEEDDDIGPLVEDVEEQ